MQAYIDRIFFAANGHVEGDIYYYRLIRRDDNKVWVWNNITKALAEVVDWADSVVDAPENGTNGEYPIVIPADVPGGSYYVTVYKMVGSFPANIDDVQDNYLCKIGDIFGF